MTEGQVAEYYQAIIRGMATRIERLERDRRLLLLQVNQKYAQFLRQQFAEGHDANEHCN